MLLCYTLAPLILGDGASGPSVVRGLFTRDDILPLNAAARAQHNPTAQTIKPDAD